MERRSGKVPTTSVDELEQTASRVPLEILPGKIRMLGRLLPLPTLRRGAERHAPASREVARLAQPVSAPGPLPHPQRLRCTDPDDQCFIDLAVSRRTPWLITRDHALRRLARRARAFGVAVVTPEGWAAAQASSAPWPHPHPLP